jgi:hypothetical protein
MAAGTSRLGFAALCVIVASVAGAVDGSTDRRTKREDLIGAWRLTRIEVTGAKGDEVDPFYGTGSDGIMIYDAAGWFSVQIMGSRRPALDPPASRPEHGDAAHQARKAEALDSYYAYYGTWTFDAAASTVTHHALGALYPTEDGANYTQHVVVHGATMTFTRSQRSPGAQTVQTKVWERAAAQ